MRLMFLHLMFVQRMVYMLLCNYIVMLAGGTNFRHDEVMPRHARLWFDEKFYDGETAELF